MKHRVLIVDDDRAILEVLEMRLVAMGFEVVAASEPSPALDAVGRGRFDVALVDLRMEPMDGIALMENIHARQPRLPVLIMTAHGTIETAVEAVQRGAFDYLTKPFERDELRAKMNRALAARRWARDRERLRAVGETLASSGDMGRILDAVAQAAVETTEAERSVVFLLEKGRLVPMASAGMPPSSWSHLEAAAAQAMEKGVPVTAAGAEGRVIVASPLIVERGPAGALVVETPAHVEPTEDDLELLALVSAQAAVGLRNSHELARLRSGALAALGRMATQVAHELKNPLAGLRLYARHLEQRLEKTGDGDGAGLARKITGTVDHLASVVSDITAFGRPPELQRTKLALVPLLEECLTFATARANVTELEIVREWDAACPEIHADARELRKAFLNLLLNAMEATGRRGRVTVGTSFDAATGTVVVAIDDTGHGMNEETLARAFDLFFTTKPEGTGLGMATVRSAVERHGGEIDVQSAPGRGTRVRLRFPVGPEGRTEDAG